MGQVKLSAQFTWKRATDQFLEAIQSALATHRLDRHKLAA